MAKRMILMLTVTVAIIAALGFVKFKQIQTAIAEGAAFQPPPEAVTTIVAQVEEWPSTLEAIGTAAAVQGVTVSTDLPGTVDRIAFTSGQAVQEGQLLAQLDARQERSQLTAVEAQRDLARLNFSRMKGLLEQRVISQAEFDRAMTDQKHSDAQSGEIQTTIQRKTIRAPFSGILGIRQVNLGQYLAAGDPIVLLQSLNPIYVNFGVPQQDAGQIRAGRKVRITAEDLAGLTFDGPRHRRRRGRGRGDAQRAGAGDAQQPRRASCGPGMFVQADVVLGASRQVIALARAGDQLRAVWRFRVHRDRPEGPERRVVPRGAAAVRQAGRLARRPGRRRRAASARVTRW